MIKHTNIKKNNAQNRLQSLKKQSNTGGFVRILILLIVLVATLIYFKIDPVSVWQNIFQPLLVWFFDIFINFIEFLYGVAIWIVEKLRNYTWL